MGLEVVELIMSTEEVFDVEIPDEAMERFATVGDIYLYLLTRLGVPLYDAPSGTTLPSSHNWTRETVWSALREVIVRVLAVHPEQVTLTAHLVDDLGMD